MTITKFEYRKASESEKLFVNENDIHTDGDVLIQIVIREDESEDDTLSIYIRYNNGKHEGLTVRPTKDKMTLSRLMPEGATLYHIAENCIPDPSILIVREIFAK